MSSPHSFQPPPRKRINDPLHGAVFLSPAEFDIAASPTFVRLANVKQLGLGGYVYPGATYSRFEHSIGACHVVGEMLEAIEANAGARVSRHDRELTRIAALLHDLGHYPFSHAAEEAVTASEGWNSADYFEDHEELGHFIIENDPVVSQIIFDAGLSPAEVVARLEGGDETSSCGQSA